MQTEGDPSAAANTALTIRTSSRRRKSSTRFPTVEWDAFTGLDGGPYPAQSTGPIYQINQNWTNIRGNHTIKFGGYFERAGQNDFDQINVAGVPGGTNNQNGRFVFANATPGARAWRLPMRPSASLKPTPSWARAPSRRIAATCTVVRAGFVEGDAETAPGSRRAEYDHSAVLQPVAQYGAV